MVPLLIEIPGGFLTNDDFREFWELGPMDEILMPLVTETVCVHLGVTHANRWFVLTWEEHPAVPSREEFFTRHSRLPDRDVIALMDEHREQFPPIQRHREVTRREAARLIMAWCLPDEFHPDVQLVP